MLGPGEHELKSFQYQAFPAVRVILRTGKTLLSEQWGSRYSVTPQTYVPSCYLVSRAWEKYIVGGIIAGSLSLQGVTREDGEGCARGPWCRKEGHAQAAVCADKRSHVSYSDTIIVAISTASCLGSRMFERRRRSEVTTYEYADRLCSRG